MKASTTNRKKGQSVAEYMILVCLVGVGSIGVIQMLSSNTQRALGRAANALGGEESDIEMKKVQEKHFKVRDLGDFDEGVTDNENKKKQ